MFRGEVVLLTEVIGEDVDEAGPRRSGGGLADERQQSEDE
jgi:hypothetical protein